VVQLGDRSSFTLEELDSFLSPVVLVLKNFKRDIAPKLKLSR